MRVTAALSPVGYFYRVEPTQLMAESVQEEDVKHNAFTTTIIDHVVIQSSSSASKFVSLPCQPKIARRRSMAAAAHSSYRRPTPVTGERGDAMSSS